MPALRRDRHGIHRRDVAFAFRDRGARYPLKKIFCVFLNA